VVWEVVADGRRLREWLVPVDESEAAGELGPAQRHVVRGPWPGGKRFEIERLDGEAPEDMWHRGTWLAVSLEPAGDGTTVTVSGSQQPAPGWEERLRASVPMIEESLRESLERLERLVAGG
jgi:uncharacterized protein YndB with AHSA1/START domain